MMKVHMVKCYLILNILNCDGCKKEKQLWGQRPKTNHDTHFYNKPVMFQV